MAPGSIPAKNTPPSTMQKIQDSKKMHGTEKKIAEDEFMAAAIGDTEWLRQSVRGNRGQVNFDKNGLSALHLAAIHGRLDCLKLLVEKFKFDVNLPSNTGWRPIHLAISNQTGKRSFQCLCYLLEKGADPSAENEDCITPMHQAASEGHVQCLKVLIDVGARIDGQDSRGHKPLDLAKLWGHKKCARILAAETWHQEKDFIAKEMKQLQKVKMQEVLNEIEAEEQQKADSEFYGNIAFDDWLQKHGIVNKSADQKSKSNSKSDVGGHHNRAAGNSLHKANSLQRKSAGEKFKRSELTPVKQETPLSTESTGMMWDESSDMELLQKLDGPEEKPKETPKVEYVPYRNPNQWNKSCKVPAPSYVNKLPDHYPRDPYTMLPKYPPKKGGVPPPAAEKATFPEGMKVDPDKALRAPQLPPETIANALKPMGRKEIVFKCRNIMDVFNKKHYEYDALPRSESGLHLTSDPRSVVFQMALYLPKSAQPPRTANSSNSSSTFTPSGKEDVGLALQRLVKPTKFPNIKGHEYEFNTGQFVGL